VVFEDETGFTLHPRLGFGWAKRGKRLKVPTASDHHKRLNLFGWVAPLLGRVGLTPTPSGNREGFLTCLQSLYRRLRGYTISLYVDGAGWHKGKEVDLFLQTHTRIHLTYLPRYQPGLNPQERIWRRVRYEATTNRSFEKIETIWNTVQETTASWSPRKIKQLCQLC
jgi:transposase